MSHSFRFKHFILIIFLFLSAAPSFGQSLQIGAGSFGSLEFGPMNSSIVDSVFSRHAYIYPASTLSSTVNGDSVSLTHGDTIRSLAFFKIGLEAMIGNPSLKIYLKNTALANFGTGNIDWVSESNTTGCELVYEGDPSSIVTFSPGFKRFDFNKADFYVFDTTGGRIHLEVLVEYIQYDGQNTNISWGFETAGTVPGFSSADEGKYVNNPFPIVSQTDAISINKPAIRIDIFKHKHNLAIDMVYTLGKYPILSNRGDTLKAVVTNVGLDKQYNRPVYLKVRGANYFNDSLTIDSIAPHQSVTVGFASHTADSIGFEDITFQLGKDDYSQIDSVTVTRSVTYNDYSHVDPLSPNSGGIGFNGGTGDFVGKFYADTGKFINQVAVDFTGSGNQFKIGIWKDDGAGGLPGTLLFESDTLISVTGTYVLPLLPRIKVSDGFFIGVRQISTTNIGFGFQWEIPIRSNTFYFAAPLGDTNWVSFSPGFNFKFNIQPRLQVKHDISPIQIHAPTQDQEYLVGSTDSIYPSASFINFGIEDEDSVEFRAEIFDLYNLRVYNESVFVDLDSDSTIKIDFKPYKLAITGDYKLVVTSRLTGDLSPENDRLEHNFSLVKNNDIAVDNLFQPQYDSKWEMNVDTLLPIVRVVNVGNNAKLNIPVTCQFSQDSQLFYSVTKRVDLTSGESIILEFDSFAVPAHGEIDVTVFCAAFQDTFSFNDTIKSGIIGIKSNDVAADAFLKPADNGKLGENTTINPYVEIFNEGLLSQDSAFVYLHYFDEDMKEIYGDTTIVNVSAFSRIQAIMKPFTTPGLNRTVSMRMIVFIDDDQDHSNDTLLGLYTIVPGKDIAILNTTPQVDSIFSIQDTAIVPRFILRNVGVNDFDDSLLIFTQVDYNGISVLDTIHQNVTLSTDNQQVLTLDSVHLNTPGEIRFSIVIDEDNQSIFSVNDTLKASIHHQRYKDLKLGNTQFKPLISSQIEVRKDTIYPEIEVVNVGRLKTFKPTVDLSIKDQFGTELYSETATIDSIDQRETSNAVFPKFFVQDSGRYYWNAQLHYAEDQFNLEHEDSSSLSGVITVQGMAVSILLPNDTGQFLIQTTYAPSGTVKHVGAAAEANYTAEMRVLGNNAVIYSNTSSFTLKKDEITTVRFDSSLRYAGLLDAVAMLIIKNEDDFFSLDDTVFVSFQFDKPNSVEKYDNNVVMYPNPTSRLTTISSRNGIDKILLINSLGQEITVSSKRKSQMQIEISVGHLAPGVYVVQVFTKSGYSPLRLIIK